ncbi:hypothetical protein Tco_0748076 [Tanacetum coccineum]|uniref:Integrase, catalytic region, zinc finger, CCHC-type, peptidase aspartic, catalytic n=1 Tax=Tanacetum coccineum TaxID=301880 RepID=A0ABQ4YX67_9ASTR
MMSEALRASGTDNRPPMLEESDYESWKIRIEWYIKGSPAGTVIQPRDKRDEEFTDAENLKELCDIQASNILSQEHAMKKLKKQEQSSSVVDPLAYLVKTTHQQAPTHSTTTSPLQLTPAYASTSSSTAQSHDDAMLAIMKQIANLLSGFQKQFPPTNNQLRDELQVILGIRDIEAIRTTGRVLTTRRRLSAITAIKKDMFPAKNNGTLLDAEAEAFLADVECTVPLTEPLALTTTNILSQINEVRIFNDNIFETVSPSWPFEVPQDEHLDSDDDLVHEDYTILYDQYLATKESPDVLTEASPIPPTAAYMLQMLTNLTTQVEGHHKVIVTCNKINAKLEQETELLKTTLRNKEATIASLTSETKTVLSEKKTLEDKYLEEIVCLKNANQVATGLLQKFQMPTQIIPMLLLQPGHAPITVPDSHETLLETEASHMKMSQKLGHVTPVDYAKLNALYDQFVPQKELSSEQVYWLSAFDIAGQSSDPPKPVTPFVHTRPVNSKVHTKVWKIKECLTPFEEVIKKRTTPPSDVLYHREYNCIKKCFDEEVIPFFNNIKQLFQLLDHNIYMEVKEFERIFNELDVEYERCALKNKNLTIEKKNLLFKNDSLIAECLEKDICSIVLSCDIDVPPISDCMCAELRTSYDREHNRVLELEAEISKVKFQNFKECSFNKQALEIELTQLKDAITSVRIQNDSFRVENVNLKRLYHELSTSNSHSRDALTGKITALTAENAKLKTKLIIKIRSGPTASEKPKVLASRMYTNNSKTKPTTDSHKPMLKSHTQNHHILPSKSVYVGRAADHNRKLNVVDHNQFVIRSLKSVNTKTPQAKHSVNHTKKV